MSLSTALSNALSGLNASTLQATLVSDNIANAQNPDYTRKVADLAAVDLAGKGAGVQVTGVRLVEDAAIIASRRRSDADLAAGNTALDGLERIAAALGGPEDPGALAALAGAFETALLGAANDPGSDVRLSSAVTAAGRYGDRIGALSTETQSLRLAADAEIATQVEKVNANLRTIESLNREIRMLTVSGADASALVDARKTLIDEISGILPIRSQQRPMGEVALYTGSGATLLDGRAATLGFTATPTITQDMTLASGALSGLTLNDRPFSVGEPLGTGMVDGGSLGALFLQRDTTLPGFANQLDALAEDLVLRFQDAAIDATRAPGDPGLFTDAGAAYDPADRDGLARRITVNSAFDGAAWRLRDGLGAAAPGDPGAGALLDALERAATALRSPDPVLGLTTDGGLAEFAAGLSGVAAARALQAETTAGQAAAVNSTLRGAEQAVSGVDTDREMQNLLAVERSYSANAFVLSTVDKMIRRLLEI